MSQMVKGFGCRPVVSYPPVLTAGVRKPPRKEPAGAGGRSAVYGDLVGRLLGSVVRWPGLSASERRSGSRFGRRGGGRRGEVGVMSRGGRAFRVCEGKAVPTREARFAGGGTGER